MSPRTSHLRTFSLVASALGLIGLAVGLSADRSRAEPRPGPAAPVAPAVPSGSPVAVPVTPATPPVGPFAPPPPPVTVTTEGKIQIALLLDTSSSMSGLIDQARTQLWRVVNEFSRARLAGARPRLEIALYEYGKSSLSAEKGWIRQIVPFTDDLDRVSEELFALDTNGGDEYCGQVIRDATAELEWSAAPGDLKLIFIAGNEPFDQGPVAFRGAVRSARERGIVVNTIHCGDHAEGARTGWRDGAVLAGGEYLAIDHNAKAIHIAAPQDDEISRLGVALNGTYVPYGARGAESAARQAAQDANAAGSLPGVLSQRAVSKSSALYSNSGWDLVDASRDGRVDVAKLEEGQLPAELRGKSEGERKAYVEAKAAERAGLQARIRELDEERRKFVAAELAKRAGGEDTLDAAVLKAAHAHAESKGWRFE